MACCQRNNCQPSHKGEITPHEYQRERTDYDVALCKLTKFPMNPCDCACSQHNFTVPSCGIRHEMFVLACDGMHQGDIAARVGVARKPVNRILLRQAATVSLEPESTRTPRKTTVRHNAHSPECSPKTASRVPVPHWEDEEFVWSSCWP